GAHALRERAALDAAARAAGIRPQRLEADHIEQRVRMLREPGSQRGEPLQSALEQLLFLGRAIHHVLDDILVLSAKGAELRELFGDARLPRFEQRADASEERPQLGLRRRADDAA